MAESVQMSLPKLKRIGVERAQLSEAPRLTSIPIESRPVFTLRIANPMDPRAGCGVVSSRQVSQRPAPPL